MLAPWLVVAALGLGGLYLTQPVEWDMSRIRQEQSRGDIHDMLYHDMSEAGISWGTQVTHNLNMANLNEAWKPRTAPRQEPTNNLSDVLRDQADVNSYLQFNAYPFYFARRTEMPLATAQQSNPNVEIPFRNKSFRGDPGDSLAYYPRVYADVSSPERIQGIYAGDLGTMGHGEPDTWMEFWVPRQGRLNRDMNPWGPMGVLQRLYSAFYEMITAERGVDRSSIGLPSPLDYRPLRYGVV